ncbi:hypothetical protein BB560_003130 [Smittium megazygosporum]|uniref:Large ribosomal subunit protein bL32m n=1 Tax=Smittium megazygosporum TaxID=133381 RepID=A0A2T9ZCY4_9FUNG|nr:hypothetical protein BB560_003130 [Smittium megazygosporum]
MSSICSRSIQSSSSAIVRLETRILQRFQGNSFAFFNKNGFIPRRMIFGLNLSEIFEAILRAVPKKKTTHSKKRMRAAGKGLKDRKDIVRCPACGHAKLTGHVCMNCYKAIRERLRKDKAE